MKVLLHTDHHIVIDAEIAERIEANTAVDLARFATRLTRVDLHLTDQSAGRNAGEHVRCIAEARPTGLAPVVVTHEAPDAEAALSGAVTDLLAALAHTFTRRTGKNARETIRRP